MVIWMLATGAQAQTLTLNPLVPGQPTTIDVSGLNAGETGYFVRADTLGVGPCPNKLGGLCLDVSGSVKVLGNAVADGSGNASFQITIPAATPVGTTYGFQVVAARGLQGVNSVKTNAVLGTVATLGALCPVYADPNVLPGGDGSAANPYPSIGYALAYRDLACDDIRLYPGTYNELVDFNGQDVSVSSLEGPLTTILTAQVPGNLVNFDNGETEGAALSGITLRCSTAAVPWRRGIYVSGASPTLTDLVIEQCNADPGGAVYYLNGGGELSDSVIRSNTETAVYMADATTHVLRNHFEANNHVNGGSSYASALYALRGTPTIAGNTFTANLGASASGPYVMRLDYVDALVANNVFHDNLGSGTLYTYYDAGSAVVNNTFADNQGYGIYAYYSSSAAFLNNIIYDSSSYEAYSYGNTPVFRRNNVFPTSFGGNWSAQLGVNGNIAVDPIFTSATDYSLQWTSSCVDAGENTSSYGVTDDFDGTLRPMGLGYDMGAFESW